MSDLIKEESTSATDTIDLKMDSPFRFAFWGPPLTQIPEDTVIWRYMDLGKLVSMLANQALYFPVVDRLDDKFEAVRPKLPAGSTEIEQRQAWFSGNLWRRTCFVNCWHCLPTESAAMWEIYAGRDQGIAIRSTFQSLASAFRLAERDDQLVQAGLVEYIDPDWEEAMPRRIDGKKEVLRKRSWYSYEKELRLIFTVSKEKVDRPDDWPKRSADGFLVRCDLRKLIEQVVVSPKAPPYLESAVRELLKLFKFEPELVRSSRMNEPVFRVERSLDREVGMSAE